MTRIPGDQDAQAADTAAALEAAASVTGVEPSLGISSSKRQLSDKALNVKRRERYRNNPEYREKRAAYARKWREANADKLKASKAQYYREHVAGNYDTERAREIHVRRSYGLSLDQVMQKEIEQDGKCAICRQPVQLHIDHDHKTNEFRGLLCPNCNRGLGMFGDDPELLLKAADYLLSYADATAALAEAER